MSAMTPFPHPHPPAPARSIGLFLLGLATVAGLAEVAYAIVNVSTLPVFLKNGLGLPNLVGISITAFAGAEALLNSPMGSLADRLGRRRLIVLGALISVGTCFASTLIRIPPNAGDTYLAFIIAVLIGLRVLDGVGAAAIWPAVFASVGDKVEEKRQAGAMSILNITYMIGLAFGPLIGGAVNNTFGGRFEATTPLRYIPSFYAAAACFLVAAIVAFFIAPRRSEQHHVVPGEVGDLHSAPVSKGAVRTALRRIPALMALLFLTFFGVGLIAPNVKLFAMERYHIDELVFGKLMLYPALFIAALAVPVGRLGDVWGKARSIQIGIGLCAVSLWMILLLPSEWALVALGSLMGIGFVLAFPAYMALVGELTRPEERGGIIGAVRMAQGIGLMIGAPLASPLYEGISHRAPFILAAVFLSVSFGLSLLFIRERRRPAALVS